MFLAPLAALHPQKASWQQTYSYDRFGNRQIDAGNTTANVLPASNPSLNPATNRINDNQGYSYDAAGNVTVMPRGGNSYSYVYDAENRQVRYNNGASQYTDGTDYAYDGDGRRVKKVDGGGATIFVYNALGQMVAEYSNAAAVANGTQYLTSDTLGTPRVVTGADGAVKGRHDYLPFGEEVGAGVGGRTTGQGYSQVDNVRQKFAGTERDGETGLDFMQARYYSSTQGRFTSVDKLFFQKEMLTDPQRFNLYAYVRNNPLRFIDPTGDAIQLIGTEEERKQLLEALRNGAGKAGDRLYENKVVDKDGTVRYFVGIKGDAGDFAKMNEVAGELAPIIADTRIAALDFVENKSTVTSMDGEKVRLNSEGKGDAFALTVPAHENLVNIYIAKPPSAGYEDTPGYVMKDGRPAPRDLAIIGYHELGHARAYMTGDVGSVSKIDAIGAALGFSAPNRREDKAALRLENKVRRLRDPSAAPRVMH